MMASQESTNELNRRLNQLQRIALLIGGVGLLLVVVGALFDLNQTFQSYLFSYLFWLGISLGCLAWLLIHGMTGGRWGNVIHPLLQSSALLIGLMALLFIPLLFGLDRLYIWAQPETVAHDPLLQHKVPYLNIPFFIGRAVLYFVVWVAIVWLLGRWWRTLAQQPNPRLAERVSRFSGIGLGLYGLTMTFGSFDWLMSLDPHWYSTIFGVLVVAGQACTALAFIVTVLGYFGHLPFLPTITDRHISDLGNLLLTAVIFWSYIAFIQFFIIWSADLPEDVLWYLHRIEGGWQWVPIGLILFHFVVPFLFLLSSEVKRNARRLANVALLVLVADLVHLFWLVAPTYAHGHLAVHWLDIVMPVFVGGLWLAGFVWMLRRYMARPGALPAASGD